MKIIQLILILPILFYTVLAPGSNNWCQNSWSKLIIIYMVYFLLAMGLAYIKLIKDKMVIVCSGILAGISLILSLFPSTVFWNLTFDYACPNGSHWGGRSYASWTNPFERGLYDFVLLESEALMFSFLMLCYTCFFVLRLLRTKRNLRHS